jgi:hypothetical protein
LLRSLARSLASAVARKLASAVARKLAAAVSVRAGNEAVDERKQTYKNKKALIRTTE